MENNHKKKYEDFHAITSAQFKIIKKNNFTYRNLIEVLDKHIKSYKEKDILDIGCGAGTISLFMAVRGSNVLGIDISEKAISSCKKSRNALGLKKVAFRVMNFPRQVPIGKFDCVVCSEVIEHLEDDVLALKKFFGLLNSNGIAVISVPSTNAPLYKLGLAKAFDEKVGHLRRYSVQGLVDECRKCGFEILEIKKTEGILRNFLFLNHIASNFIKFIKFFVSDLVTFIDNLFIPLFGESNIIIVARKPR